MSEIDDPMRPAGIVWPILFAVIFWGLITVFCIKRCEAGVNFEISYGRTVGHTDNGNFWWDGVQTENILQDSSYSVGATVDIFQSKHFGLKTSARYNYFKSFRGNNNTVCAPDGCAAGIMAVANTYRMNVRQKTSGYTFGLIGEIKYYGVSLQPEFGGYYGRTSIDSQLMDMNGAFLGNIVVKNHVTTYYYGGRVGYDFGPASIFIGYRCYPSIGGNESFVHYIEEYSTGLYIPLRFW